jgi:hypothetical protein
MPYRGSSSSSRRDPGEHVLGRRREAGKARRVDATGGGGKRPITDDTRCGDAVVPEGQAAGGRGDTLDLRPGKEDIPAGISGPRPVVILMSHGR